MTVYLDSFTISLELLLKRKWLTTTEQEKRTSRGRRGRREKETEERDTEEEHRWVTIQTIRNITVKVEKNVFNSSICTRGYYSIAGG